MTDTTAPVGGAPPARLQRRGSAFAGIAVMGIALVVVGLTVHRSDLLLQGATALTLATVATGLGLALGLAGEFVLGIAAVYATGSYTTAALTTHFEWNFWEAALAGMVLGALVGIVLSLPGLRVGKFYFGMMGFFLIFLIPDIAQIFDTYTNGSRGLSVLTIPELFGTRLSYTGMFFLAAAGLVIALLVSQNIRRSPLGTHMRIMRESPTALSASGVHVWRVRLATYVAASVFAGLGGAIYSHLSGFLLPSDFSLDTTNLLLAAVIVGGARSLLGPCLGVFILYVVPRTVFNVEGYADIVYGVIVVASVLLFRGGVIESAQDAVRAFARGRSGMRTPDEQSADVVARSPEVLADTIRGLREEQLGEREIQVSGVRKRYGGVVALDFEDQDAVAVRTGQVHLLLGPNGSGKTTLLNAMTGIVRPDAGSVTLNGRAIHRSSVARIAQMGVSRSFQGPALPDEVSPVDLFATALADASRVSYGHWLISDWVAVRTRRRARRLAAQIAEQAGLGDAAHLPCRGLTSGQRRIVDVVQALLSATSSIVLLDEPAAGLGDLERRQLAATIRALADRGLGFLVVEHDLDFALGLADVVTVMAQGRPAESGTPDDIRTSAILRELLMGVADVV